MRKAFHSQHRGARRKEPRMTPSLLPAKYKPSAVRYAPATLDELRARLNRISETDYVRHLTRIFGTQLSDDERRRSLESHNLDLEALASTLLSQLDELDAFLATHDGEVSLRAFSGRQIAGLIAEERHTLTRYAEIRRHLEGLHKNIATYTEHHVSPLAPAFVNGWGMTPTYKGLDRMVRVIERGDRDATWTDTNGQTCPSAVICDDDRGTMVLSMRGEDGSRTPEQAAIELLWAKVRAMDDTTSDVLLYLLARWVQQGCKPGEWMYVSAKSVLEARGIQPMHKKSEHQDPAWRQGHRTEDRHQVGRALMQLRGLWLKVADFEVAPPRGKKRSQPTRVQIDDPVLHTGMHATAIDAQGKDVLLACRVQLGEWAGKFVQTLGPQYGPLSQKALEYDPYRKGPEKRLAKYLAFHFRANARHDVLLRKVGTLLDAIGADSLKQDRDHPERTKTRLETALDTLCRDGVIGSWSYDTDQLQLPARRWLPVWVNWTISIVPPKAVLEARRGNPRLPEPKS